MSLKSFIRALGKALLYFAIYFVWQIIVVNWVSIGATFYVSSGYSDAEMLDYNAVMYEITDRVYEIIDRYALHITLAAGILAVLTFVIIFRIRGKKPLAEMGITKLPVMQIPILILFGLSLNMFISVFLGFIPFPESWIESYNVSNEVFVESGRLITLLTTLVCAPIVEEITFRGLMYSRLCQGMPMFAAMLISSWVFGMVHGNIIQMCYAALFGYIFCYIRIKYQSLTACICVHFGFNLFTVIGERFGELSDRAYYMIMLVGAAISLLLLIYIGRYSDNKIQFSIKESVADE